MVPIEKKTAFVLLLLLNSMQFKFNFNITQFLSNALNSHAPYIKNKCWKECLIVTGSISLLYKQCYILHYGNDGTQKKV